MTCCRPPRGKRSASCSAVSDNLPYRTLERKEPAHDDCHRAPAPGSLHACLWQPEDEDRVAQRIADLEVATGRDGNELLAVQLVHRGRRVDTGAAVELPQDGARLGVVRLEPAVALAGEHQAAGGGGRAAHHRQLGLLLPDDLAGVQVDRADQAVLARVPALLVRNPDECATEPQATLLPRGVVDFVVHRLMQGHGVRKVHYAPWEKGRLWLGSA